jgi:hypothetical protein
MKTAVPEEADVREQEQHAVRAGGRARRTAVALAGPVLITLSVVFAMRGFLFRPYITDQHPDILAMWLPRYCFLGSSLASGHVPLWNPYQSTGAPYASDAQSGWLYLPVMALFSQLSCGAALRVLIAFNPLLGGLSLYWLLRKEDLHRTASTVGGLSYAMIMATSTVAISLPFAGALAWTPLVLVGASGWMRAGTWLRHLPWLALGTVAWGQVAAAHMSHGLLMCSCFAAAYLIARTVHVVRSEHERARRSILMSLGFAAFLVLANTAIILPHLLLVGRTSLRGGYAALGVQLTEAAGVNNAPLPEGGVFSGWPFVLASAPGAFAGATVLLSILLAVRTRGKRYLAAAFASVGLGAWILTLDALVGATWFRNLVLRLPFGDVYLHNPGRLRYALLLVGPVLGAIGIQGLIDRPIEGRRAYAWLGAGLGLFLVLPLVMGAHPARFGILLAGAVFAVPALVALARHRRWAFVAVPAVLTAELLASAVFSQTHQGGPPLLGLEPGQEEAARPLPLPLTEEDVRVGPLRWPEVPESDYLTPGVIARKLQVQPARYLTWAPPAAYFEKGYLSTQDETYWPALENGRGMLFGVPDPMGYSPIQLARYWAYIRATNSLPLFYNASVLQEPTLTDLQLLGVRYLIVPEDLQPPVAAQPVITEGGWELSSVVGWEPRVSVVPEWTVVADPAEALEQVLRYGFDPGVQAAVEGDPGVQPVPEAPPGVARYSETTPEDVQIGVEAAAPSLVLVRNAYDTGWSATVDDEPAPVLRADWFLQAVPVPSGKHEIHLVYRDPTIGRGLTASAVVWGIWVVALVASPVVARRRARPRAT